MAAFGKTYTVLVVDDQEATRLLVGRILSQELGARIVLAGTCERALHLAGETAFDVIVLDLMMPGSGGFELLKRLRMDSANRATPVVVLSEVVDEESMLLCRVLGAGSFVSKPVEHQRIVEVVTELLPSHAARIHARSWRQPERTRG